MGANTSILKILEEADIGYSMDVPVTTYELIKEEAIKFC
jgi:hypothetical protein